MTTIDELEARIRALESEVTGEKAVTRYAITQANLGANDIAAIRTDVRQLTQDVTLLRQEATVLRRGQEELNARVDARFDSLERRMETLEHNVAAILAAITAR